MVRTVTRSYTVAQGDGDGIGCGLAAVPVLPWGAGDMLKLSYPDDVPHGEERSESFPFFFGGPAPAGVNAENRCYSSAGVTRSRSGE